MAGGDRLADGAELDAHGHPLADGHGLRMLVRVAVREVEEAAREQQRRAVGRDVAQPDGDQRERLVGRQLEHGARAAQ